MRNNKNKSQPQQSLLITETVGSLNLLCHPTVLRFSSSTRDTLGLLYINGIFQHYTLEDEFRAVKVMGDTRIPANVYPLALRTEGGKHEKYKAHSNPAIRKMHKGMLHITQVPNFKYVLYHIGNDEEDTDACTLCGDAVNNNQLYKGYLKSSTAAYIRTYPKLLKYVLETKKPIIQFIDIC